jgi:hypothetical protein
MILRALPGMSPTTKLSWAKQIWSVIQVQENDTVDYVTRVLDSPLALSAKAWNDLLAGQDHATPFMRHEYLAALHRLDAALHDPLAGR